MKKLLLIIVCCLCLVGCNSNSWKKDFQVSDVKIKVSKNLSGKNTYLTYSVKNISNHDCNYVNATVEFKSDSLISSETSSQGKIFIIKPNETVDFEDVIYDKDYDGYNATITNIEYYKLDTK